MKKRASVDKPLALLILILLVGGCLIFASAAFGLLARGATNMSSVVFSHLVLGVGLGVVALLIGATVDYHRWRRYAPYIYALAILATLAVFLPYIGFTHGGARRWLVVSGVSFQPSELLKIASILLPLRISPQSKQRSLRLPTGSVGLRLCSPCRRSRSFCNRTLGHSASFAYQSWRYFLPPAHRGNSSEP